MKKAYVLCSGGLDSVTVAHYVKKNLKYSRIVIVFFNYGQRNLKEERKAAKFAAKELKCELIEQNIQSLMTLIKSGLTNKERAKNGKKLSNTKKESTQWYVPCRNIIFLTLVCAIIESKKEKAEIFVGFKNEGEEFFKDASPDFLKIFNELSVNSTELKPKINAPFIKKDKEDIVKIGIKLGAKLEKTYSCYTGQEIQCGECLSCRLRKAGFYWAGIEDKTEYQK